MEHSWTIETTSQNDSIFEKRDCMDIMFFNKNRPLMMLDLDLKTSYVKEIKHIHDKDAMPLAMFLEDEKELGENFTRWWRD